MAVREIVTLPAPVLRRKAHKVSEFGPELHKLLEDMIDTMRDAPGVGLAATQVNVPLRVIVVEYGEEEDEDARPKLYQVINPEITRFGDEKEVGTEGCLSVPGYVGDVERSLEITLKGQNRQGKPIRIKAKGWLARIFQHELDHIDGVVFVDRAERVWEYKGETTQVAPAD